MFNQTHVASTPLYLLISFWGIGCWRSCRQIVIPPSKCVKLSVSKIGVLSQFLLHLGRASHGKDTRDHYSTRALHICIPITRPRKKGSVIKSTCVLSYTKKPKSTPQLFPSHYAIYVTLIWAIQPRPPTRRHIYSHTRIHIYSSIRLHKPLTQIMMQILCMREEGKYFGGEIICSSYSRIFGVWECGCVFF